MASRREPKIASPGNKAAEPAPKKSKKDTPAAAAAPSGPIAINTATDPSALIARLCPVDIIGGVKTLGQYKGKVIAFDRAVENTSGARGDMNAKKKELINAGWEGDAVSLAMKLWKMDPEKAQRVLSQAMVLCRSEHLNVPLGAIGLGVIDGTSVDLFDPDRVYKHGKPTYQETKTEAKAEVAKATAPQSQTERMADIFENGRALGLKGQHLKIPDGIKDDPKAVQSFEAGWTRGQSELLAKGGKPSGTDNVVQMQKPTASAVPPKAAKTAASGADAEFS